MAGNSDAIGRLALGVLGIFQFFMCPPVLGSQCFAPPVNHIFSSSQDEFYCPGYRNLIRHIPLEDGLCPSSSIYRKHKNCLSDKDCPRDTYCCFSACHGITRCYNPYNNEWAEKIPESTYKSPCPLIQVPEPNKTVLPANETATVKPKPIAPVSLVDEEEELTTRPPIVEEPKKLQPSEPPVVTKPEIVTTVKPIVETTTVRVATTPKPVETTPGEVTTGMPPTTTEAPTEKPASAEDVTTGTPSVHPRLLTTTGQPDATSTITVEISTATSMASYVDTTSSQPSNLTLKGDLEFQPISPKHVTLKPESSTSKSVSSKSNQKSTMEAGVGTKETDEWFGVAIKAADAAWHKNASSSTTITKNSTKKKESVKSSSSSSRDGNSSQRESFSISIKNAATESPSSSMEAKNLTKTETSSSASNKSQDLAGKLLAVSTNRSGLESKQSKNTRLVSWSSASPSSTSAMVSKKSANETRSQSSSSSSKTHFASQFKELISEISRIQPAGLKNRSDSALAAEKVMFQNKKKFQNDASEGSQKEASADVNSENVDTSAVSNQASFISGRSISSSSGAASILSNESENRTSSDAETKSLHGETADESKNEAEKKQEGEPVNSSAENKTSSRTKIVTNSTNFSTSVRKSSASSIKSDDNRSSDAKTSSEAGSWQNSKEHGGESVEAEASSSSSDSQQYFNRDFFANRGVNTWDSSKFGTQLPPFQPMTPIIPSPVSQMGNLPNINFPPMSMPGIPPLEYPKLPALPQLPPFPNLPDLPQLPPIPQLPNFSQPPPLDDPSKAPDEKE